MIGASPDRRETGGTFGFSQVEAFQLHPSPPRGEDRRGGLTTRFGLAGERGTTPSPNLSPGGERD